MRRQEGWGAALGGLQAHQVFVLSSKKSTQEQIIAKCPLTGTALGMHSLHLSQN